MASVDEVAKLVAKMERLTQKVQVLRAERDNTPPTEEVLTLRAKIAAMEKAMSRSQIFGNYQLHTEVVDPNIQGRLPEKFNMSDLPVFKGTDNPQDHLRALSTYLGLRGVNKELYMHIFPQTLDNAVRAWYFSLDPQKIPDWNTMTTLFLERYADNVTTLVTLRDLELTKQYDNESITPFIKRWRGKVAEMLERPTEKDQIRLLIKNLQPKYYEPLKYQPIATYTQLHDVGVLIEDDILSSESKAKVACSHNTTQYEDEKATSSTAPEVNLTVVRPRKPYTPLTMSVGEAFNKLSTEGFIAQIGPTPDPPKHKRFKTWDDSAYCKYHQGNGHDTEKCFTLKNRIQDLIDEGVIAAP